MRVKFFTDSSIYQPTYDKHYQVFKDNGGCLDVVRSTQGTSFVDDSLDEHYANNKAVGQNMGLYHWIDPTQTGQANADYFSRQIDKYKVPLIAGDLEQWWEWESWSACYEKHLIPASQIVRLPSQKIFDVSAKFFDVINIRYKEMTRVIYTAKWFTDGFLSGYNTYSIAKDLKKWLAFYFNLGQGDLYWSWDQFKAKMDSLVAPAIPAGWGPEWDMWQITSNVLVPQMPRIDYNIINPASTVNSFFGVPIPPTPIYTTFIPILMKPPEVNTVLYHVFVNVSWLTVCDGPGATFTPVNWLAYNTPLDILEEKNGWGRFTGGWVNLRYTRR